MWLIDFKILFLFISFSLVYQIPNCYGFSSSNNNYCNSSCHIPVASDLTFCKMVNWFTCLDQFTQNTTIEKDSQAQNEYNALDLEHRPDVYNRQKCITFMKNFICSKYFFKCTTESGESYNGVCFKLCQLAYEECHMLSDDWRECKNTTIIANSNVSDCTGKGLSGSEEENNLALIISISVGLFLLCIGFAIFVFWYFFKRVKPSREYHPVPEKENEDEELFVPPSYATSLNVN